MVDPPLWTLRYETMCYVLLALFAGLGLLATRTRAGLTLALILAVYVLVTFATPLRGEFGAIDSAMRFILGFFVGGALYLFADKIRLSLGVALLLGVAAFAAYGTPVFEMALQSGARLRADLVRAGACWRDQALQRVNLIGRSYKFPTDLQLSLCLRRTQPRLSPDGYPRDALSSDCASRALSRLDIRMAKTIATCFTANNNLPLGLFFCSFPAVLALAVLSWHFVEHPALSRKAWAGDCVGSLLHGVRQRLAASFGSAAAAK